MFDAIPQILLSICFAVVVMTVLWFVQRRTKNASIVDVAWAGTVGVLGVFFAATSDGDPLRRALAGTMIGLWSLRLTVYLFRRVVGYPEEGRYVTLRRNWGGRADVRLFRFFQTQAAAAVVFALPVLVASHNAAPLSVVAGWLSLSIWCVGILGLVMADRQLARFKADRCNRGITCGRGLWRYSRHPNYFFEWVHWWAYAPLALGASFGWVALAVPMLLLYFLLFVTGIPPTEAQSLASRGEDYRRYQRTTSRFFPWFPRK